MLSDFSPQLVQPKVVKALNTATFMIESEAERLCQGSKKAKGKRQKEGGNHFLLNGFPLSFAFYLFTFTFFS
jgi:hypothetical protein